MENTKLYEELDSAIFDQDIALIKELISKGADINEPNEDEDEPFTFLSVAEDQDDLSFADTLVTLGASVSLTADFREKIDGQDALSVSLHMGYLVSAKELIVRCEDFSRLYKGRAPIHHVLSNLKLNGERTVELLNLLIDNGADKNLLDDEGVSALDIALGAYDLYETDESKKCVEILKD